MSVEQQEQVRNIHSELEKACSAWPTQAWDGEDKYGLFLEKFIARVISGREIEFAYGEVQKSDQGCSSHFHAVFFTSRLLIIGSIKVPERKTGEQLPGPNNASVTALPRTAIRRVELQELFGFALNEQSFDTPGFTLHLDGHPPITIKSMAQHGTGERASKLLDTLIEGLA